MAPNNKKYFGITSQSPQKRWQNGYAYRNNPHFFNAIKKYGWDAFQHKILHDSLTENQAKRIEIDLISKHKSNLHGFGYNRSTGGEGATGRVVTHESIIKMSNSHKGKKLTREQRRKISIAGKGRKLSQEHIAAISKAHKGKFVSDETRALISKRTKEGMNSDVRAKIRKANLGRKASVATKQKFSSMRRGRTWKPQALISVDVNTAVVSPYSSLIDAVNWLEKTGTQRAAGESICRCLSGRRKTAYGKYWGRLDFEDE